MKRTPTRHASQILAPSAASPVDRRVFLRAGLAGMVAATTVTWLLPGCAVPLPTDPTDDAGAGGDANTPDAPAVADDAIVPDAAVAPDAPVVMPGPTPECLETNTNLLGPYYRAGAPMRSDIAAVDKRGTRLTVSGRVFGLGDGCLAPLPDVLLDIWQADEDGRYDNDPSMPPPGPERFVLRGRLLTDVRGAFAFRTIVPGRYLNGPQYRPAHVHARLSVRGYRTLTTQLYFPDDPFNEIDTIIRPGLIMDVTDLPDGSRDAHFDFVLRAV